MVLRAIPKMSPDFFLALLDALDFNSVTKIWIVLHEKSVGIKDEPDGCRVFTNKTVHYVWKGDDIQKLRTFDKWESIDTLDIQWEKKSLLVSDCSTTMTLYGFYSLPDIKTLPGQRPQNIILRV